jgi:hypothetical protein
MTFDDYALVILGLLSLGSAVYWFAGLYRTWLTSQTIPTARDGLQLPPPPAATSLDPKSWPTLICVIPAHNEGHVIADLARSLKAQDYPNFRVIFSLDRCTDDTQAKIESVVAGDDRFVIHTIAACPPDWAGKVHAIYSAIEQRPEAKQADLLAFIDADCTLDPGCLRACVQLRCAEQCELLSLLSTLGSHHWFEKLIQPATALELVRQFPPLRVNRDRSTRSLANGQFMLFTRAAYEAIGGHAKVRFELLEDLAMAQLVKNRAGMSKVYFADGMLICRMYESWAAFVRGWRRLFIEMANRRPGRLLKSLCMAVMFGTVLPLVSLLTLILAGLRASELGSDGSLSSIIAISAAGAGMLGYLAMLLCLVVGFRLGKAPMVAAVVFPAATAVVGWLLWTARRDLVNRVPVKWAGREYIREPRVGRETAPIR